MGHCPKNYIHQRPLRYSWHPGLLGIARSSQSSPQGLVFSRSKRANIRPVASILHRPASVWWQFSPISCGKINERIPVGHAVRYLIGLFQSFCHGSSTKRNPPESNIKLGSGHASNILFPCRIPAVEVIANNLSGIARNKTGFRDYLG